MATSADATRKLSIKLLVNKDTSNVLFAEADKDFVDFLLGLLALPIATVVRLLGESRFVGSLGKLHQSLGSLDNSYMQPGFDKDVLLNPWIPHERPNNFLLLGSSSASIPTVAKKYYYCTSCIRGTVTLTESHGMSCPHCSRQMTSSPTIVSNTNQGSASVPAKTQGGHEGYVKGVVTYMVMDDLVVKPMSTISSITLLNKFHVKDVGALEEKVVEVGLEEGLKLLEVSLRSSTVLTDVLLKKEKVVL